MIFKTYEYGEVWCEATSGKRPKAPTVIVLHHTGGNGNRVSEVNYLRRNDRGVSIHYHVAKDGYQTRMVADDVIAHHVGNSLIGSMGPPNLAALGIEISNRGDGKDLYPQDQVDSVAQICAKWIYQYPTIKMFTPHGGIDTKGKYDPVEFPWGYFFIYMTARLNQMYIEGGVYDKCPNLSKSSWPS